MLDALERAADLIEEADALIVSAGAGMGVDSGLPDFRGDEGFWRAYPPLRDLGLSFADMANPLWFQEDPSRAWGFYGHRLALYRATTPHAGFGALLDWGARLPGGLFVFTSNVDGQFARAGVDAARIYECHGSLMHLQCTVPCGSAIWSAETTEVDVDLASFRALGPLPTCRSCGAVARPNVLMFGDATWLDGRSAGQASRLDAWLSARGSDRVVIVECGAGTAVPSVRRFSDGLVARGLAALVRINPREPGTPAGGIGVPAGALEALTALDERLGSLGSR